MDMKEYYQILQDLVFFSQVRPLFCIENEQVLENVIRDIFRKMLSWHYARPNTLVENENKIIPFRSVGETRTKFVHKNVKQKV